MSTERPGRKRDDMTLIIMSNNMLSPEDIQVKL